MSTEDRIRQTLNDADWSLPVWASPRAQLRRAARRRRAVLGATAVAVIAAVTVGLVVPRNAAATRTIRPRAPVVAQPGDINDTDPRLPAVNDPRFPANIYPLPIAPARGQYPGCPSLLGVGQRPSLNPAEYAGIVTDFGHPSMLNDLRRADRELWPLIRAVDTNPAFQPPRPESASTLDPSRDITVIPTIQDDSRGPALLECGRFLVDRSVSVRVGPIAPIDPPDEYFSVLQRHGHLLIWSQDPSIVAGSFLGYRDQPDVMYPRALSPCYGLGTVHEPPRPQSSIRLTVRDSTRAGEGPCWLIGWSTATLVSAFGHPPVHPQDVGPDTPVLLEPGESASFVITARKCSGTHTPYEDIKGLGIFEEVDLTLGRCGATVSSYHLD